MLLTLGAVAIAAGMMDAVLPSTVLALREAVAVVAALAVLDGADDLAVGEGQMGVALQVLGRKGGEERAEGRHDRSLPS
jgi:transcriptional regulator of nitric oxide reductase